mgnify:CR=1 FL=1
MVAVSDIAYTSMMLAVIRLIGRSLLGQDVLECDLEGPGVGECQRMRPVGALIAFHLRAIDMHFVSLDCFTKLS